MTPAPIDEAKIRETAYLMWLDEGQPQGRDEEHWRKAVDALSAPVAKKPRKAAAKPAAKAKAAKPAAKAKAAKPKAKAAKKPAAKKTAKLDA
jgi:hypothetical protein